MRAFATRNQYGSMGGLLFSGALISILGLGAFALDLAHITAVRSELQNAADAAALAGADAYAKLEPDQAETHALEVASVNTADGRAVSNESPDTEITVATLHGGGNGEPHVVEVNAAMNVNHMLAPIFGRKRDRITVVSRAGCYDQVRVLAGNQAFPIAINPQAWPRGAGGTDDKLQTLHMGDHVVIVVDPAATPGRNAAWTSFNLGSANTNDYRHLIDQALGLVPYDPNYAIPDIEVGVDSIALDNGLNRGTDLEGYYRDIILAKPFLCFPLVIGDAYNQDRVCVGFVTIKITSITQTSGNYTLEGTIIKGIVRGWGGQIPSTNNADTDHAVFDLAPALVKLLSNES